MCALHRALWPNQRMTALWPWALWPTQTEFDTLAVGALTQTVEIGTITDEDSVSGIHPLNFESQFVSACIICIELSNVDEDLTTRSLVCFHIATYRCICACFCSECVCSPCSSSLAFARPCDVYVNLQCDAIHLIARGFISLKKWSSVTRL